MSNKAYVPIQAVNMGIKRQNKFRLYHPAPVYIGKAPADNQDPQIAKGVTCRFKMATHRDVSVMIIDRLTVAVHTGPEGPGGLPEIPGIRAFAAKNKVHNTAAAASKVACDPKMSTTIV